MTIHAEAKHEEETFFALAIEQAGIFMIEDKDDTELHKILGAYCPNILFPYAREVITNLIQRAGLPALYLSPVDFDAIYLEEIVKSGGHMGHESLH